MCAGESRFLHILQEVRPVCKTHNQFIASYKNAGINVYHHRIPADLTALINEWVDVWRPQRLPEAGSDLVFLNELGRPFRGNSLNLMFFKVIYRITGMRTTIHMVRDSYASEYLDATGDVAGCADKLGDTVEMVLKHYAHILKRRARIGPIVGCRTT